MLGTAFSSLLALLLQSTNVDSFLPEEAFFIVRIFTTTPNIWYIASIMGSRCIFVLPYGH